MARHLLTRIPVTTKVAGLLIGMAGGLACGCASIDEGPGTDDFCEDGAKCDSPSVRHLRLGTPKDSTPDDDLLISREQYVLSYNRFLNAANWVSWRQVASDYGDAPRFPGPFISDTSLPADFYHPVHADYDNSGFDRGHMVRSEERTRTDADNKATFILSNVLPQTPDLNRGPWLALENFVQRVVTLKGGPHDLYIIAGGVWAPACLKHQLRAAGDSCKDIGHSSTPTQRIGVPDATFKIVAMVDAGQSPVTSLQSGSTIAVIIPNQGNIRTSSWTDYITTVNEIERLTGYRFMSALSNTKRREFAAEKYDCNAQTMKCKHADGLDPDSDLNLFIGCGFAQVSCTEDADCCSDYCNEDGTCW